MSAVLKFLAAARSLANQGLSKEAIEQFAKNEFGEINELLQGQINNIFKPGKGIPSIKKDPDFDDTVIQMQIDEFGPFNPKDPLKNLKKQTENQKYNQSLLEQKGINFLKKNLEKEKKQLEKATELEKISRELLEDTKKGKPPKDEKAQGGRAGFKSGSYLFEGAKKLGKKYRGSTLEAILENPKILGTELGYESLAEILRMSGMMQAGGRVGLKNGMSRRKFMKIMGGLATLPIVGKFFKLGKVATKAAPIVKTPPVAGKPEWFDSLVNKVILEGDDVTKQFATKEREIVHTKKLEEGKFADEVTVYRDLDDGTIRVEYSSVDNMSEAPVNLTFKPGMADETTRGKPADMFQADEIVPESRMVGPDDFEIEDAIDEFDNVTDLNSDVSKLKQFAGQKLTTKEIVEGINKRKRSRAIVEDRSEAADFMTSRQGDYDPSPDDFASGGIARMLGE